MLREAHVLFSEAYWTRESFAPTFSKLFLWLTAATPIAAWAGLRRVGLTRYIELRERFQTERGSGALTRLTIDTGVWAAQPTVMPAVYNLGALCSQMLIGVFRLLGPIVPSP